MAGAGGIEPPNAGTKNRCLTAWRRPNMELQAPVKGRNGSENYIKFRGKASPVFGNILNFFYMGKSAEICTIYKF
jgi:hypothetical protein